MFLGFKGNKFAATYSEFGYPSDDTLPEHYKSHLKKIKAQYSEYKMRPSKFGKLKIDKRTDKFNSRNIVPFRKTNTV